MGKKLNLDLKELLSVGPYKEKYWKETIECSDQVRSQDYGHFCREAAKTIEKDIVVVGAIRRKNKIKFFEETYSDLIKTVRIQAYEKVRVQRGWKFQAGVDDVQSECDLGDYKGWDLVIQNNNNGGNGTEIGTLKVNKGDHLQASWVDAPRDQVISAGQGSRNELQDPRP